MAREIYYQQVGNPLQLKRLPKRRPDLQLAYHPHTPGQDTRLAVKMLFLLLLFSVAGTFTHALCLRGRTVSDYSGLFLVNFALLAFGLSFLVKAIQERSFRWLKSPLACLVVAFCYLNTPVPLSGKLLIASMGLGLFTWLLATHWSALCTSSPVDRSVAAKLRSGWNGYLAVVALAPTAFVMLNWVAQHPCLQSCL